MSHPFFSAVRFLVSTTWKGRPVRDTPEIYARLRDAYLQPWAEFASVDRLVAAFELARLLQPLQYALTYWHLWQLLAHEGIHLRWERRGVAARSLKGLLGQKAVLEEV